MSPVERLIEEIHHLPHIHKTDEKAGLWDADKLCFPPHTHIMAESGKHSGVIGKIMSPLHHHTRVAVAGITGALGQLIVKSLLAKEHVEVHGIARNPDKLPSSLKSNDRLKLFKTDMKNVSELRHAVKGCSILIAAVLSDPASEIAMQKAMIDACLAEGVHRFMPNDFTLDWRSINLELLPMKKVNREIDEYLQKHHHKIKGVHVLCGAFYETVFSAGFWFDPTKSPADGLSSWGSGNEIWELSSYENVAQWTAAVALDKEATGYLRFLGDRLSLKEVARALQDAYDLPSIPFTSKGSLEEVRHLVEQGIRNNPSSTNPWDWKLPAYCYFLTNGEAYLETPLNNNRYITEVQQDTVESWLRSRKLGDLAKTRVALSTQ